MISCARLAPTPGPGRPDPRGRYLVRRDGGLLFGRDTYEEAARSAIQAVIAGGDVTICDRATGLAWPVSRRD